MELVSCAAVKEDCSSGLVIDFFDDSDKVGADVLLHGCTQSCMSNPVEGQGLLEVCEDKVQVLLVLDVFLTEDSQIEDLLCGAPSCYEACLFFSDNLLPLWLQSIQYDLQHDSAWEADYEVKVKVDKYRRIAKCNEEKDLGIILNVFLF